METVAGAMLIAPKLCGPRATVAEVRDLFADDHVHGALLVDGSRLVAVVTPSDLLGAPAHEPAAAYGRLRGRMVGMGAELDAVRRWMLAHAVRRLAVVDPGGELQGLLCLKRSGTGFCSEAGVFARAEERRGGVRQDGLREKVPA